MPTTHLHAEDLLGPREVVQRPMSRAACRLLTRGIGQHAQLDRARRLLAAADEQRRAACALGDSELILLANAARYRARAILADLTRTETTP